MKLPFGPINSFLASFITDLRELKFHGCSCVESFLERSWYSYWHEFLSKGYFFFLCNYEVDGKESIGDWQLFCLKDCCLYHPVVYLLMLMKNLLRLRSPKEESQFTSAVHLTVADCVPSHLINVGQQLIDIYRWSSTYVLSTIIAPSICVDLVNFIIIKLWITLAWFLGCLPQLIIGFLPLQVSSGDGWLKGQSVNFSGNIRSLLPLYLFQLLKWLIFFQNIGGSWQNFKRWGFLILSDYSIFVPIFVPWAHKKNNQDCYHGCSFWIASFTNSCLTLVFSSIILEQVNSLNHVILNRLL